MADSFNSKDEYAGISNGKSPIHWNPNVMSTPSFNVKDSSLSSSQNLKLSSKKYIFPPASSLPWWKNSKGYRYGENFGSPSYPSPLDRIRRKERATQLGLDSPQNKEPYEGNQSLPPIPTNEELLKKEPLSSVSSISKPTQLLAAQGLHSFSFSPECSRGSFSSSHLATLPNSSFAEISSDSWIYYNFVGRNNNQNMVFPSSVQNPNKAVLTVNTKTKEVLVVNKMACQMFSCESSLIIGHKFDEFLVQEHQTQMLDEMEIDENSGKMLPVSGKVVDIRNAEGAVVPVSLWIRHICLDENNPRSLVVMEPVQRTSGNIIFDETGKILRCDWELAALHGIKNVDDIIGTKITQFIPSLKIPVLKQKDRFSKHLRKQRVTGKTINGKTFPLSIRLNLTYADEGLDTSDPDNIPIPGPLFHGLVWVFTSISGIITISPDGIIQSCNNNFSTLLFGFLESDLIGKNISTLIPTFHDDTDFLDTDSMPLPPFDDDEHSLSGLCDSRNSDFSPLTSPLRPPNPTNCEDDSLVEDAVENLEKLDLNDSSHVGSCEILNCQNSQRKRSVGEFVKCVSADLIRSTDVNSPVDDDNNKSYKTLETGLDDNSKNIEHVNNNHRDDTRNGYSRNDHRHNFSVDSTVKNENGDAGSSSSPNSPSRLERQQSFKRCTSIPEGSYFGVGLHSEGAEISILYQVKRVELENGTTLYCVWVSIDPEETNEGGRNSCSMTLASSFSSSVLEASTSSMHSLKDQSKNAVDQLDGSCLSLNKSEISDSIYISGPYSHSYSTLKQIGKGAFGCVKMSFRNSDNALVITKFIRKSKVYKDCWIMDHDAKKKIPLEIKLLTALSHPNIVKVLDIFENDKYYQMVMEKHGSGMDLFEFIDRGPRLDEKLTSYIFRQIVDGIAYLHSLNIVHRDIKDENIILDNRFNIKLIDFGSASLMTEGHLFSTFCGTMEYCSPEVLLGNRYKGPELEMWALGITLFTLVFGENPFYNAEETIAAKILWPFQVSDELKEIIAGLLNKDPKARLVLSDLKTNKWIYQIIDIGNYQLGDIIHASKEEINPSKYYIKEHYSYDATDLGGKYLLSTPKSEDKSLTDSLIESC